MINSKKHGVTTFILAKELLFQDDNDVVTIRTFNEVCEILGVSHSTLRNLFHKYCGMSPNAYVLRKKMEKAKELLERSEITITEICYQIGYENFSKMSEMFKKIHGLSPTEYRQFHKNKLLTEVKC
ncbi:MAG: helix-turn-helix domain-containing protein [Clostridia bacterium]